MAELMVTSKFIDSYILNGTQYDFQEIETMFWKLKSCNNPFQQEWLHMPSIFVVMFEIFKSQYSEFCNLEDSGADMAAIQ